ncbi:MAG TPA: FtsQ-type POTRA domain-containing protein [Actinomycetes bacterium]|nr:FtsQ-type POTRA domain-containing protein [Actinomycetes bacterium]
MTQIATQGTTQGRKQRPTAVTPWVRRPWVWVAAGVLVLGLIAALLRFAPLFQVEHVTVSGNSQLPGDEVVTAAAIDDGTRLLTAPLADIESRVESLDAVADARVTRDWPNTIRIVVRDRRPVGYVELADGAGMVGSDGSVYRVEPGVPSDLPRLPDVAVSDVGDSYLAHLDAAGRASFDVASSLERRMQKTVSTIDATDERSVVLTTDDGVTIRWGSSSAARAKAQVVTLLMSRPGWGSRFTEVNVVAPDAPATTARE